MTDSENKQLSLFQQDIAQAWKDKNQLGRLYIDIFNLKFFVCGRQKTKDKIPTLIKRDIVVNNTTINIKLRPQIIQDDNEIKYRYLTDIDLEILDYIIYKASQNIFDIPKVFISLNEMNRVLNYNKKRIKESLFLLTQYKVDFDSIEYEGVLPNCFLENIIIERGRHARTCITLSDRLYRYVKENHYIIMNYDKLFKLKSQIAKILFKRINITNVFNYGETDKVLTFKDSILTILNQYNINYSTPMQKTRLFNEIDTALVELVEIKVLKHYKKEPIMLNGVVKDFIITLYFRNDFVKNYAINQKMKKLLNDEQLNKVITSELG